MQANRRTFDRNDKTISQSPDEEEAFFKAENRGKTSACQISAQDVRLSRLHAG